MSRFATISITGESKNVREVRGQEKLERAQNWFMDDGGRGDFARNEGKQIHIHTQGFTEEGVKAMCQELSQKFGLKASAKPNKGAYVIAISGDSYERFKELVEPYLVNSMKRKLPLARKGGRRKS